MKTLFTCIALLLAVSGCATRPTLANKFPDAPPSLLTSCAKLKSVEERAPLSKFIKTVSINYASYHECSAKQDAWREWYAEQKKITNKISE